MTAFLLNAPTGVLLFPHVSHIGLFGGHFTQDVLLIPARDSRGKFSKLIGWANAQIRNGPHREPPLRLENVMSKRNTIKWDESLDEAIADIPYPWLTYDLAHIKAQDTLAHLCWYTSGLESQLVFTSRNWSVGCVDVAVNPVELLTRIDWPGLRPDDTPSNLINPNRYGKRNATTIVTQWSLTTLPPESSSTSHYQWRFH